MGLHKLIMFPNYRESFRVFRKANPLRLEQAVVDLKNGCVLTNHRKAEFLVRPPLVTFL